MTRYQGIIDIPALVIGAGPAGLMAADAVSQAGFPVMVAEAKPSPARKFLMAGKSGLNLTKMESEAAFETAFAEAGPTLRPMLRALPPKKIQAWAESLGQPCFTGSTGRLFPKAMKASPLLRSWLARLSEQGVDLRTRWRWTRWDGALCCFDTPNGAVAVRPRITILALGGASWARLGSDGAWAATLASDGAALAPFAAANAALSVSWSPQMTRFFGTPLKSLRLTAGNLTSRGEVVISARGLEGGGLYSLTPRLREGATLRIDLCPDLGIPELTARLSREGKGQSQSNRLRRAGIGPAAVALARDFHHPLPQAPADLAERLKNIELAGATVRPLDEAISTAGGLSFSAVDADLMLRHRPDTYAVGEMLDWEAPTGGYLLSACFATGLWAGRAAARRLAEGENEHTQGS